MCRYSNSLSGSSTWKPWAKPSGMTSICASSWTQFLGVPLQERGRSGPQIDRHVPDPAAQAADHLHFRVRRTLEMHAAHGAGAAGSGLIDLRNLAVAQHELKFLGAEEPEERAAGIAVRHGLHDLEIGQWGVQDVHAVAQPRPELTASAT